MLSRQGDREERSGEQQEQRLVGGNEGLQTCLRLGKLRVRTIPLRSPHGPIGPAIAFLLQTDTYGRCEGPGWRRMQSGGEDRHRLDLACLPVGKLLCKAWVTREFFWRADGDDAALVQPDGAIDAAKCWPPVVDEHQGAVARLFG